MKTSSRKHQTRSRIRENDKRPGRILDIFRRDLGLSHERVGEILDCSFQQVGKYLHGTNRMPPAHILTCSEYFRVSPAVFFREAEHPAEIDDLLDRAILEQQLFEIQESLTIEEINLLIDVSKILFDLRQEN